MPKTYAYTSGLTMPCVCQKHHHAALPDHDLREELPRHAANPAGPGQYTGGGQSQVSVCVCVCVRVIPTVECMY